MNEVKFDIQNSEDGNLVVPLIDGKSLISILKDVELPFAKKEGSPKIAGSYDGLFISGVRPPSEYFYGKETTRLDGKTQILICSCLIAGCWDFICKIDVTSKKVIWKNFEQVHRKNWNYEGLGIFEFDRKQYENALKELESK
jgi:hypothetical protein